MKKVATLIGSAALFAAALVPAIAASNDCSNSTTGPFSNNTCTILNSDNITVNNVNDAQIKNYIKAESETGGNSASYNTLGGNIVTGNASTNVTVSNVANVNTTNVTAALAAAAQNSGSNTITGPFSNNTAYIANNFTADVWNSNTASVKNRVEAESETGENNADFNTGPASVITGNAWTGLLVNNHVNDNLTQIMGAAGGQGSNSAENSTTGPFSVNEISLLNNHAARVTNVNDLQVKNYVEAESDSGDNSASKNTLGGAVDTGNAFTGVGVDTQGNINTTLIAMAMGGFNNSGSNSVTGPGDNGGGDPNIIYIENDRQVVVDNWNNKCESHNADRLDHPLYSHRGYNLTLSDHEKGECDPENLGVLNVVEAEAETGESVADFNTGGGGVMSGYAELLQQVLTHINDTLTEIL